MGAYGGEGTFITTAAARLGLGAASLTPVQSTTPADFDKVSTSLVVTVVLEPIWLISTTSGSKVRKGIPRWIWGAQGNNGCDTYGAQTYVQLSNNNQPSFVAGPWDGVTTPSNS